VVWSCYDTSFTENINVVFKKFIHKIVERFIESRSSSTTKRDVLTRVGSLGIETPWGISQLLYAGTGRLPAASLTLTLLLIDSHISAISSQGLLYSAGLREGSCD
jgi:hypothetical protein